MIHVKDELLDDPEDKGRRNLYNVGNGKGYYATNGKIEPIVWEKKSRSGKTTYYNMKGEELTFNDGITLGIIITLLLFIECALIICIKNDLYPTAIDVYQGKTTLKYITVDGVKVDSIVVFKKDVTNLNIY
jgi:hypothetical protein